jgi:serine/threonine protein kinase
MPSKGAELNQGGAADDAAIETIVGQRFRVSRQLKTGQGIETLLATDITTHQEVIIKTTKAQTVSNGARQRLEHEALILREVQSEWLSGLLEMKDDAEMFYLATLYIDGMNLQERLEQGPLKLIEAIVLVQL